MFRKIITTALLVSLFTLASGSQAFARTRSIDENQTVSQKTESKNEPRRDAFVKKENQPNFTEKDNLSAYQKQKSQVKRFSTGTKILIGVGIAAAVIGIVVFAASRDKIETF